MAFQGVAAFTGVKDVLACSFDLGLGIVPSVCMMEIAPQADYPRSGTLTLTYGADVFSFQDCVVDHVHQNTTENGQTWTLHILDRRWRWQRFGKIVGKYNIRRDETQILKDTIKSPQELATTLLLAMGETPLAARAAVLDLPNDSFPEVEWDYINPARALASLCGDLGVSVALTLDNRPKLVKLGEGKPAPADDGTMLSEGVTSDTNTKPEYIFLAGAPTKFQKDFPLFPVGLDVDGTVKHINDLSYCPKNGWSAEDIDFHSIENEQARGLAQQTVWKWYSIRPPQGFILDPMLHFDGLVNWAEDAVRGRLALNTFHPWQALPLLTTQVDTMGVEGVHLNNNRAALGEDRKHREPKPAQVYGKFYSGDEDPTHWLGPVFGVLAHENIGVGFVDNHLYPGGFNLDVAAGIVKFPKPVYRLKQFGRDFFEPNQDDWKPLVEGVPGYLHQPALLWLRTGFHLRGSDHNVKDRPMWGMGENGTRFRYFEDELFIPGDDNPPTPGEVQKIHRQSNAIIIRDDHIKMHVVERFGREGGHADEAEAEVGRPEEIGPGFGEEGDNLRQNNYIDCKKQADFRLLEEWKLYGEQTSASVYAGLRRFEPNGLVRRVLWSISPEGFATTSLSENTEDAASGPTLAEQRFIQRTQDLLEKERAEDDFGR